MGRNKVTIRAQRKYAHRAHIPGTPYREVEPPELVQPPLNGVGVVTKARKSVHEVLDEMAFQNIHRHAQPEVLKDVWVVLERIKETNQANNPQNQANNPQPADIEMQVDPGPSTSKANNTKKQIKPRIVTRQWLAENTIVAKLNTRSSAKNNTLKRAQRRVAASIDSRISSADDNTPLEYFAKKKFNKTKETRLLSKTTTAKITKVTKKTLEIKATRTSLRQAALRAKRINQKKQQAAKRVSQPKQKTKQIKENPRKNIRTIRRRLPTPTVHEKRMGTIQMRSLIDNRPLDGGMTSPILMPIVTDVRTVRGIGIPVFEPMPDTLEDVAERFIIEDSIPLVQQETPTIQRMPSNPFADFVVKIFNDSDTVAERVQNEPDSMTRVHEWIIKNTQQQSENQEPQTSQFKVPSTPVRRAERICAPSPSTSVSTPAITNEEAHLRTTCPTWNYRSLCAAFENRMLIQQICSRCIRCQVMFKLASPITDDIDASSEVSTGTDHVARIIRQTITDKGKKVIRAALIIKNKIEVNEPLLPKEHTILARAISILIECKSGRVEPPSEVSLPIERPSVPRPSVRPSTSPRDDDYALLIPTSSKQARMSDTSEETHTQGIFLHSALQESPKFCPTPFEFAQGSLKFATEVQEKFVGISLCGIEPPNTFMSQSNVGGSGMKFKISNQYIHRMLNRWGSATKELTAIRAKQDPKMKRSPLFQGLEVDLVKLYHTVQGENGIESCQSNTEKWEVIARKMKLHFRGKPNTRLENIYLKYLLGYNTLTSDERDKLSADVNGVWRNREVESIKRAKAPLWRQERMRRGLTITDEAELDIDKVCAEAEECVTPGRQTDYNTFQMLAQQVAKTYFPSVANPTPDQVEREYWEIVTSASSHVCVHSASVDAIEHGSGFTDDSSMPYSAQPWNIKKLWTCPDNLLGYLGLLLGVTSPAIHYGMMFSTSCWHKDPTSVSWIEYLHCGAPKIWYSISADQEQKFRLAVETLCPFAAQNKPIWLPSDIIMIPPNLLRKFGVNVERHVQLPGEYVIVYPNAYSACIDTGFNISEGAYYATPAWINGIDDRILKLRNSCEPSLFSMVKLLIEIAKSKKTPQDLLQRVQPVLSTMLFNEISLRQKLVDRCIEILSPKAFLEQNQKCSMGSWQMLSTTECAYCRCHLDLSRVIGVTSGPTAVCSTHGIQLYDSAVARRNDQMTNVYCIAMVSNSDIYDITTLMKDRMIQSLLQTQS